MALCGRGVAIFIYFNVLMGVERQLAKMAKAPGFDTENYEFESHIGGIRGVNLGIRGEIGSVFGIGVKGEN